MKCRCVRIEQLDTKGESWSLQGIYGMSMEGKEGWEAANDDASALRSASATLSTVV